MTNEESIKRKGKAKTMVIFGSGGHTSEMLKLIHKLDATLYSPMFFILAKTDITSFQKIQSSKLTFPSIQYIRIHRSREVKQSWLSSIWTILLSIIECFWIFHSLRPDLIICNGPGTCVPLCYVATLFRILHIHSTKIIFVESFCRVKSLSLTGKLLYPIADRFVVQWPELLSDRYVRAEYIGKVF
mmetsp:Transcript_36823/g.37477  ORF Transcript_36823/g.37477 Transcript_36823/m.37477 type:complete len:186 (-) Transcript_36823:143-700(-)